MRKSTGLFIVKRMESPETRLYMTSRFDSHNRLILVGLNEFQPMEVINYNDFIHASLSVSDLLSSICIGTRGMGCSSYQHIKALKTCTTLAATEMHVVNLVLSHIFVV